MLPKIIKDIKFEMEEMEKLVTPIHQVWEKFKSEFSSFLEILESKSPEVKSDG